MATYTIVKGDNLSSIAARNGTTVQQLLAANPSITNPNLIYAGASLNLPTAPAPANPAPAPAPAGGVTYPQNPPAPSQMGIGNQDPNRAPGPDGRPIPQLPKPYGGTPAQPQDPLAGGGTTTPVPTGTPPVPGAAPAPNTPPTYDQAQQGIGNQNPNQPGAPQLPKPLGGTPPIPQRPIANESTPPLGSIYLHDPSEMVGVPKNQLWKDPASDKYWKTLPPTTSTTPPGPPGTPSAAAPPSPTIPPGTIPDPNDQVIIDAITNAGLTFADIKDIINIVSTPTQLEIDAERQKLGLPAAEQAAFAHPSQSTQQIYLDAYKAAGIDKIKAQFDALTDEINKQKKDLVGSTYSINENPWNSEASRVGHMKNLIELSSGTISNLVAQQQQVADLYKRGIDEVNGVVLRTTTDFTNNQAIDTAKLNYLQLRAASELTTLESTKKKDSLFRYLPAYTEAQKKALAKKAPDTIGDSRTGFYAYDQGTGKFVMVVPPADFSANAGETQHYIGSARTGYGVYDPKTGKFTQLIPPADFSTGAKAAAGTSIDKAYSQELSGVMKSITGADGFVNPVRFRNIREEVFVQYGAKGLKEFDDAYPANRYLSPEEQLKFNIDLGKTPAADIPDTSLPDANIVPDTGDTSSIGTN